MYGAQRHTWWNIGWLQKEKHMLTTENFIDAGYKRFSNSNLNKSDFGLQKLISDEIGKRYHITVWVYDWIKYRQFEYSVKLTFSPDVQLQLKNNMYFDVKMLLNTDSTVEDIESFYN